MSRKEYISFFISFLLLVAVIFLNWYSFNRMRAYTNRVEHTQEVITSFQTLSNQLKSAQIYSPTFEPLAPEYYQHYNRESAGIITQVYILKRLVSDNPEQVRRVDSLFLLVQKQLGALRKKNTAELVQTESWRMKDLLQMHVLINEGIRHEENLLTMRRSAQDESRRQTTLFIILFSLIAFGLIAWSIVSNLLLARKRQWLEGFLQSVLNTTLNGVITCKAVRNENKIVDFEVEFANPSAEKLLGVQPQYIVGIRLRSTTSFFGDQGVFDRYAAVVETGVQDEFEMLYERAGLQRWFYVLLSKINDGVTATFHNITDLKNYQQQLTEKISQLEHSNRELEQYAYAASHDLQEPLRKIRTFASLLQDQEYSQVSPKAQSHLVKIMQSAERMSELIKALLSFSSMKKEEAFVPTDLNTIVNQVLQDLDLLITQKGATVHQENLPTVPAIPLQMTQLFYNLINNALKFSREGMAPEIRISCRQLSASELKLLQPVTQSDYYEILVQDNGVGFEPQFAEQIFGLFKRLGDVQGAAGSGIGLALCRKVVENHNGLIYAEGKTGAGATFHIVLPLQQQKKTKEVLVLSQTHE